MQANSSPARAFARTTGLPPHRFVTSRRMDRARLLLWNSDRPVDDVARAVGFSNLSHFRRVFRDFHGVAPRALRDGESLMQRIETPIALCASFARAFREFRSTRAREKPETKTTDNPSHDVAD